MLSIHYFVSEKVQVGKFGDKGWMGIAQLEGRKNSVFKLCTQHIFNIVIWCQIKDHSYSETRNPQPPLHGLLFLVSSNMHHSETG